MEARLRPARFLAVVLLLLCAWPALAQAQQFVCWPIAAGDTASSLALRLTGKADAAYGHAFQIRDPARRMFVPKSHYQRIQLDWQACVARGPVRKMPAAYAPSVKLAAWTPDQVIAPPPQAFDSAALAPGLRANQTAINVPLAATVGGALLLIILFSFVGGSLGPRPIPPSVRCAGEGFVAAFARPLIDPSAEGPPIETRLRFLRRKRQLEISIAPGPGHRYPNLADHKKNVEYDVDRVMRGLANFVLSTPPRAAGKWVVVTIRPADGKEQGPT